MSKLLRLLSVVLILGSVAHADDLAEAKRLFDQGAKAFALGDYPKAIEAHTRSFELSGHPILLFNIGQSYRKLGNNERALHFYKQFLTSNPKGKMREDAEEHIKRLEALAATVDKTKTAPPNGLVTQPETPQPPVAAPTTTSTTAVVASPPTPEKKSRKWVWGVVAGGVVVVGLAVGLGVGLTRPDRYPSPDGVVHGN